MSEHVLNVAAVSLLYEVNTAPEVGPNALVSLEWDIVDFCLDRLLQVVDCGRFLAINTVLQVPPQEEIQWGQIG